MDMAICAKQLADEGKTVDEIFAALEEKQIILFRSFIQITLNNFHVVKIITNGSQNGINVKNQSFALFR